MSITESFQKQQIYLPNQKYLSIPELAKDNQEAIIPINDVVTLNNALVTPTNHVFLKGKYIPTGLFTPDDKKILTLKQRIYFYIKFRYLTPIVKPKGVFFLAYDAWSDNYYHWLCEVMPRLVLMSEHYSEGRVILPKRLQGISFITDSIRLIGLSVYWIEETNSYIYSELVTVISDPKLAHVNPMLQSVLIAKLLNSLNIDPNRKASNKIFVSRAKAYRRLIENESEILEMLKDAGYVIIHPEDYSFAEQVVIFSNSTSVISLHGAGMTNLMFMPRGSRVMEIRDENWATNPLCYWRLANVLDIQWAYHNGKSVGELSNFNNILLDTYSFKNDLKAFESAAL